MPATARKDAKNRPLTFSVVDIEGFLCEHLHKDVRILPKNLLNSIQASIG